MNQGTSRTIAVSLAAACLFVSGCGDRTLVSVPTEREANAILVALLRSNIGSGTKSLEGKQQSASWVIRVPESQFEVALNVINAHGLPRPQREGLAGMVAKTGLIPTQTDERAKLMLATAQELERTLEALEGVVEARVTVSLPPTDPMSFRNDDKAFGSASVVLRWIPPGETNSKTRNKESIKTEAESLSLNILSGLDGMKRKVARSESIEVPTPGDKSDLTKAPTPNVVVNVVEEPRPPSAPAGTDTALQPSLIARVSTVVAAVSIVSSIVLGFLLVRSRNKNNAAPAPKPA